MYRRLLTGCLFIVTSSAFFVVVFKFINKLLNKGTHFSNKYASEEMETVVIQLFFLVNCYQCILEM